MWNKIVPYKMSTWKIVCLVVPFYACSKADDIYGNFKVKLIIPTSGNAFDRKKLSWEISFYLLHTKIWNSYHYSFLHIYVSSSVNNRIFYIIFFLNMCWYNLIWYNLIWLEWYHFHLDLSLTLLLLCTNDNKPCN